MRSFSHLMNTDEAANGRYVELAEIRLLELLRGLLHVVDVDEDWYRAMHPDVDTAIRSGCLPSARYHFIVAGYFEDRLPRPVAVDVDWYLLEYPDVAHAINEGAFRSANEHFQLHGFREGRLPRAGWSLLPLPAAPLI